MYLRVPRLIFFFLTMSLSVVVVGLTSWGIRVAYDNKHETKQTLSIATLHVQDLLGSGGAVTAAAAVSGLICFGLAFLAVFQPHRAETIKSVRIKEALFAFTAIFYFATLVPATVIVAKRSGVITAPGIPQSVIAGLVSAAGKDLRYRKQRPAISYIIVGWIAFLSNIVTFTLVCISARHVLNHGPDGGLLDNSSRRPANEKGLQNVPSASTSPEMANANRTTAV